MLNNLISNAIKYNRAQGRLGIRAAGASDSHVIIAIEDTGVGIAPDQQDKLFTPFYRAESSARSRVRGTGLGLSIAKAFVELHGGTIEVDSQPDVGSRFTVTLPIRHAPVQP